MGAELGQTSDPKALISGDPTAVHTAISVLNSFGDALVTAGDGLMQLDDGGWTGPAADAFHGWFDGEPARWITCGEAFSSAATALTSYVGVLEWAQGQAVEALRLWGEGEAATRQAKADHQRAVDQANQQAAATATAPPSIPFLDPGEATRVAARETLASARAQLHDAGDRADATVGQARDKAPEKPSLLERAGEILGDFGQGVWEGVAGLAEFAWQVSPIRQAIDPAGWAHDMVGLSAGLLNAVTHPEEFFKAVVDWETWKDNPARALGHLVPDLVLAFGTAGAGTAAARGARAARAAGRLGDDAARVVTVSRSRYPQAAKLRTYTRPSHHRQGVRDRVWENAIEPSTGRVRDPRTGRFVNKNKPWDMGHRPGYEHRKHEASAAERGISREQYLDEYNDPSHYRPELPSSNRSRRGEDHTDTYFGP